MGGEIRSVTITVTTLDTQHWHPGLLAAAEAAGVNDYHQWAVSGFRRAVQAAADRYIAEHPDLFAGVDAGVV